jgi:uncharacterized cupredoxin-like copper-binding protein
MRSKRITIGLAVAVVVGLLWLTLPSMAASEEDMPTIQIGDFFFAVLGGPQVEYPPGTPAESILTITGAADGEIELIIENVGMLLHEIRSPLFTATKEVKAEIIDAKGNVVAEVEGSNLLELELAPGWKAELKIKLAGAVKKSLAKDGNLIMTFELSCHVEGHYEAGMRALIQVAP